MRDYPLFIVENALRSKRRALLTMASVALSFCLLAMLMALYHALSLCARHSRLGASAGGSSQGFSDTGHTLVL
jgi:hypothetical protein